LGYETQWSDDFEVTYNPGSVNRSMQHQLI
jgi:hypothetical protein